MYLAMMVIMCSSDQAMISWASLHMSEDTVHPCFLIYATIVAL